MESITLIEDLAKELFLSTELFPKGKKCTLALKLFREYAINAYSKKPDPLPTLSAITNKKEFSYREVIDCVRTFVGAGLAAWIELPLMKKKEIKNQRGRRFDLLFLPPREMIDVLKIRSHSFTMGKETDDALNELEADNKDEWLLPYESAYNFQGMIPLLSAPKWFVFALSKFLMKISLSQEKLLEVIFVTQRSTAIEFPQLTSFFNEISSSNCQIKNYFDKNAVDPRAFKGMKAIGRNIQLFSIPSSVIRDDRYVLVGEYFISCHKRLSPYKSSKLSYYEDFYNVDVIKRSQAVQDFKERIAEWNKLGLCKEIEISNNN